MSKTFGRNPNGTLSVCRAKPENIGKYNCNHSEHFNFTEQELREGALNKKVEEFFNKKRVSLNKNSIPDQQEGLYSNTINGEYITKEELQSGAKSVSENFDRDTFNFLREFYSSVGENLISTNNLKNRNISKEKIAKTILLRK